MFEVFRSIQPSIGVVMKNPSNEQNLKTVIITGEYRIRLRMRERNRRQ